MNVNIYIVFPFNQFISLIQLILTRPKDSKTVLRFEIASLKVGQKIIE